MGSYTLRAGEGHSSALRWHNWIYRYGLVFWGHGGRRSHSMPFPPCAHLDKLPKVEAGPDRKARGCQEGAPGHDCLGTLCRGGGVRGGEPGDDRGGRGRDSCGSHTQQP